MHRKFCLTVFPLLCALSIWISAGVASAQAKKLACVGDSITALSSSWCGVLAKKLPEWSVKNFGVSGTNLAKSVGQPYWSSAQYKPSHDFLPNLVVIMLGTNDGVPRVWQGGKSHFVADYEELIDTYETLSSKPRVYLIIPIPAGTGPFGHDPDIIADEIGPAVKMVAMNKDVTTIDGFDLFGGKDLDESLYGSMDQIHPNAKGQGILGDAVYEALESTGGLTGMPIMPPAGDGGMLATDAGGTSTTDAGAAAADSGSATASPSGADAGRARDAGGSARPTEPKVPDGSVPSAEDESDEEGDSEDAEDPPAAAPASGDSGCQTAKGSSSRGGLTVTLLLLLGFAWRRRADGRGARGR